MLFEDVELEGVGEFLGECEKGSSVDCCFARSCFLTMCYEHNLK